MMKTVPQKKYAIQLMINIRKNKNKIKDHGSLLAMIVLHCTKTYFATVMEEVVQTEERQKERSRGEWENRTPDLVHAKHALYQLS